MAHIGNLVALERFLCAWVVLHLAIAVSLTSGFEVIHFKSRAQVPLFHDLHQLREDGAGGREKVGGERGEGGRRKEGGWNGGEGAGEEVG